MCLFEFWNPSGTYSNNSYSNISKSNRNISSNSNISNRATRVAATAKHHRYIELATHYPLGPKVLCTFIHVGLVHSCIYQQSIAVVKLSREYSFCIFIKTTQNCA